MNNLPKPDKSVKDDERDASTRADEAKKREPVSVPAQSAKWYFQWEKVYVE